MAQNPAEYSRFQGESWVRRKRSDGVEVQWRPPRTRRILMPSTLSPVATVVGDSTTTLWSLAARFFRGLSRPEELYWLIGDVNGVVDPTLALDGKVIVIPPIRILDVPLEDLPKS